MLKQWSATLTNENTRDAYVRDVGRFLEWLGSDRLASLEPEDVLAYLAYLTDEGYAASSVNRQLAAVRAFLRWAALTKKVQPQVSTAVQLIKGVRQARKLPRPLDGADLERLLDQPDLTTLGGARDLAFLTLAVATGARLSELVGLDIEDLDWERREVIVYGKGSKERVVFFDEAAASALVYYLGMRGNPQTGPLFASCARTCGEQEQRVSTRWFQRALRTYGDLAGIEGLHPHQLRHTFATEFLRQTGALRHLQDILGHADIRTTERYTHLATDDRRAVYDQFVAKRQGVRAPAAQQRAVAPV